MQAIGLKKTKTYPAYLSIHEKMNFSEKIESTSRFVMGANHEAGDDHSGNDSLMRLEDAFKIYRTGSAEIVALNGMNLALNRGSFWCIMGPSGSGKSTLLNILGCLDRCTEGSYTFAGEDVSILDDDALSELRLRKIGFIFQSFNLIQQLTVKENIELPLYYLGSDANTSADRASELAEKIGLGGRLDHKPSELSGGEQQRVAIARSLANDPEVLLADEPTGNLDTATGNQIIELLAELHAQGKTVVLVTHNPLLTSYATHRLHMRDGLIERVEKSA
jgi:putative ABC transport system ATP-binding protein